jgi:hypothetical protein
VDVSRRLRGELESSCSRSEIEVVYVGSLEAASHELLRWLW